MTPEQEQKLVAHLRELAEKATPGPWWKAGIYTALRFFSKNYGGDVFDERPQEEIDAEHMPDYSDATVQFIAEARTALPALLVLLDKERQERAKDLKVARAAREFVYGSDCTDDAVEMHGTNSLSIPAEYISFYTRVREIDGKPIEAVIAERESAANQESK